MRALLNRTVTDWLRGWVDASLRGENGKPPGVIPSAHAFKFWRGERDV